MAAQPSTPEQALGRIVTSRGADTVAWTDYLAACKRLQGPDAAGVTGPASDPAIQARVDRTGDQLHAAIVEGSVHVPDNTPRGWDQHLGWAWMHTYEIAWLYTRARYAAARRAIRSLDDANWYADIHLASSRRDPDAEQVADAWPALTPHRKAACVAGEGHWNIVAARRFCDRSDAAELGPVIAAIAPGFADSIADETRAAGFQGGGLHLATSVYERELDMSADLYRWLTRRHPHHRTLIIELGRVWTGSVHQLDQAISRLTAPE